MSYLIQSGDTLSSIAMRNGTTVGALMRANPQIADPNMIYVGQALNIPSAPPISASPNILDALSRAQTAERQMCVMPNQVVGNPVMMCHAGDADSNPLNQSLVDPEGLLTLDTASNPEDLTEFGQRFENITDMPLSESIARYKQQTEQDLSPETVETLFTDHEAAERILLADENLHRRYRDILNTSAPATEAEAINRGYTKLPVYKSIFHNPLYNPWRNSKYVSPDGHLEGVYDGDGVMVNSNDYKGTFNFFGPDQATEHWAADVVPYKEWGN